MKLLDRFQDKNEALSVKYRLEDVGIPIHLGSENSGPAPGALYADCYTIWVEIDSQLGCAQRALSDENYVPKNSVDISEYRDFSEAQLKSFRNKFSKFNDYVLNIIMLGVVGFIVYRVYIAVNM